MIKELILSPAVAFSAMVIALLILGKLFSRFAYKAGEGKGAGESYACGEDVPDHLSQPDYSQFFPFAFFFTIAHVATLILTTVPMETIRTLMMAMVYICVVVIGLYVLLRR
jgi:NADH-quinone oxidoreductase subunit A